MTNSIQTEQVEILVEAKIMERMNKITACTTESLYGAMSTIQIAKPLIGFTGEPTGETVSQTVQIPKSIITRCIGNLRATAQLILNGTSHPGLIHLYEATDDQLNEAMDRHLEASFQAKFYSDPKMRREVNAERKELSQPQLATRMVAPMPLPAPEEQTHYSELGSFGDSSHVELVDPDAADEAGRTFKMAKYGFTSLRPRLNSELASQPPKILAWMLKKNIIEAKSLCDDAAAPNRDIFFSAETQSNTQRENDERDFFKPLEKRTIRERCEVERKISYQEDIGQGPRNTARAKRRYAIAREQRLVALLGRDNFEALEAQTMRERNIMARSIEANEATAANALKGEDSGATSPEQTHYDAKKEEAKMLAQYKAQFPELWAIGERPHIPDPNMPNIASPEADNMWNNTLAG